MSINVSDKTADKGCFLKENVVQEDGKYMAGDESSALLALRTPTV